MSTPNRRHSFWWLNVFSRNKTEKYANAGRNGVSRPDGASTKDLIVGPCLNSFPSFPRLLPVSYHSSTFLRCHQSFCDLQIRSRPRVALFNSPAKSPLPFGPVFSAIEQQPPAAIRITHSQFSEIPRWTHSGHLSCKFVSRLNSFVQRTIDPVDSFPLRVLLDLEVSLGFAIWGYGSSDEHPGVLETDLPKCSPARWWRLRILSTVPGALQGLMWAQDFVFRDLSVNILHLNFTWVSSHGCCHMGFLT
jgi:hypothetical protein